VGDVGPNGLHVEWHRLEVRKLQQLRCRCRLRCPLLSHLGYLIFEQISRRGEERANPMPPKLNTTNAELIDGKFVGRPERQIAKLDGAA